MSYISKIRIAAVVLAAGAVGGGFVASSAHADGGGNIPAAKAQPTFAAAAAAAPLDDSRFAVVDKPGTLVRGKNAVAAIHLAVGNYEVAFDRDVRGCAFVGSPGNPGEGSPLFGQFTTAARSGNPNAVYVATRATDGTAADRSFHLAVIC
jgi:hypothetical protein